MLRIGLTGGIGSGKSTVAGFFAARGIPIIDTDQIAHRLSAPGGAGYHAIVAAFGDDILDQTGAIDRKRVRTRVFDNPPERKRLETLLHPLIRDEVEHELKDLRAPYAIIVVPLLIETDFTDMVDRILVVEADEEKRLARVAARDDAGASAIKKIIAAQARSEERLAHADDVIHNNHERDDLEREVERLHRHYLALAGN